MSRAALRTNDWTEKHRPRSLAELVGNKPALEELRAWAESWKSGPPEERAVILAGEPGVGKTSAALALARDMGWGLIELNASDQRNEEVIRRIAGSGARNRAFGADGAFSLDASGGRQLVVLDEADNLFGREDRGGMKAIVDTIRLAQQPIVLIANDLYELTRKGAALKGLALTIKFSKVHSRSIPPALKRIAKEEGIELDIGVAEALAERAGGDMRSAVNDFQALAIGRKRIALEDMKSIGARDTTGDVWGLMRKVFYGSSLDEARKATWDLDETPEGISLWIDENLPVMYKDRADLVEGYHWLSRADVYLGRVSRRQQYALWGYASEIMTGGVAISKREKPSFAQFQFPSWLRKQSASKSARETRNRIAKKVGTVIHTSDNRVRQDVFPYLKLLMERDSQFAAWSTWAFGFEADDLAWLLDEKATSARVKKLLEASEAYVVYDKPVESGRAFGDVEEDVGADEPDEAPADVVADEDEDEAVSAPAKSTAPAKEEEKKEAAPEPKKQRSLFEF